MNVKSVTIKDVARLAKVSPGTVSNVLGGSRPVRQASRDAVLKAVSDLNYKADPAAAYLRTGRSRVIAAVLPSLENPFFSAFVAAVERLCQRDAYELFVASSEGREEIEDERLRALMQWRPAAFFVIPVSGNVRARQQLERDGIPFAVADRRLHGDGYGLVEIDNVGAGELAARHLTELGHRRIAIVAPSFQVANIDERVQGISSALKSCGAPEPQLVELGEERTDGSVSATGIYIRPDVTGIVALTNFTTLQVLGVLAREGRVVPRDLSLVGFDDYAWMNVASPSVTAIRQPIAEMAEAVWNHLLSRIEGKASAAVHRKFEAELIVRESTAVLSGSPGD